MKRLARESVLLLALVGLPGCASSSWIKRAPEQDRDFKYYVGRSYDAQTKAEGLDVARDEAKSRAVEENFGARYKFQRDVHEEVDSSQVVDRSRAVSRTVHLESFEELEVHQEEIDEEKYNTFVLFRYPKKAIETERARLATVPQLDEKMEFAPVDVLRRNPAAIPAGESHRALNSTFVLGFGGGFSGSTMAEVDTSGAGFSVHGEVRLSRYVGLQTALQLGGKTVTYTNGNLAIQTTQVGISVPVFFSSADRVSWSPYLAPGLSGIRTGFEFQGARGTTSGASKSQAGASLDCGVQIRLSAEERSGFTVRSQIGLFRPLINSERVTGKTSAQGQLLLNWEFFQK